MSSHPVRPSPRRDAWERVTAVPLAVLGLAFIVAYSIYVLAVEADSAWHHWLSVVLITSWAVFAVDVVVRIVLTPRGDRAWFVWTHPIDVLSALVPLFRALRVLALINQVPYLRRRTGDAVRTRFVVFAVSYAVAFIYFTSLATLQVERDAPGANILTFGDAIWWAFVTIATVGYGDEYPVTAAGRFYAVLLMIGGVAIVGTASATIISLLNERIADLRHHGGRAGAGFEAAGGEGAGGEGAGGASGATGASDASRAAEPTASTGLGAVIDAIGAPGEPREPDRHPPAPREGHGEG